MRALACREGKLVPIRFQVDARTPQLNYAWTSGEEATKDRGRIDDDDEIVFMARDAGDRASPALLDLPGTQRQEVELQDPSGGRAWVYLVAWPDPEHEPPERATGSYVSLSTDASGA
ncbi:hypothetical protein HY251_21370, partial [bacterium]|nr:hypothetical protein [bacterium]